MSSLDGFLTSRIKNLEHWRLQHLNLKNSRQRQNHLDIPNLYHSDLPESAGSPLIETDTGECSSFVPPTLQDALNGLIAEDLPDHAALLGACEDGLPFLLDLTNPMPGAILIVGDTGSGKTSLVRSILTSTIWLNPAEKVSFAVVASEPDEYRTVSTAPHCREVMPVESPAVNQQISFLLDAAEKRKRQGPADPCLILAIDDLSSLLPFLDEQVFSNLLWLIRHGPRYRIWTIASYASEQIGMIKTRSLNAFRTQLFGYMRLERLAHQIAHDDSFATRSLEKGRQFFVPYSGDWLRFWICEPQPKGE